MNMSTELYQKYQYQKYQQLDEKCRQLIKAAFQDELTVRALLELDDVLPLLESLIAILSDIDRINMTLQDPLQVFEPGNPKV